jgi:hypothetical protein
MRGIGTQAIFGDDEFQVWVVLTQHGNEPFGGIAFAIIFVRAIVFHERFWHQRNHCTQVRMDNRRAQHLMSIRHASIAVDLLQT